MICDSVYLKKIWTAWCVILIIWRYEAKNENRGFIGETWFSLAVFVSNSNRVIREYLAETVLFFNQKIQWKVQKSGRHLGRNVYHSNKAHGNINFLVCIQLALLLLGLWQEKSITEKGSACVAEKSFLSHGIQAARG